MHSFDRRTDRQTEFSSLDRNLHSMQRGINLFVVIRESGLTLTELELELGLF